MGSWDPQLQEMTGVDETEVFIGALTEYEFPDRDAERGDGEPWRFYDCGFDLSPESLPYTLQGVLEFYFKLHHAVRITVEDAGPDPSVAIRERNARLAAESRERALDQLELDARDRAKHTHQPKY